MFDFVIGALLGGAVGATAVCLCAAAGRADGDPDRRSFDELDR